MKTPLQDFSEEWRDAVLNLLWRQWCALGVPGHGSPYRTALVDPEALIVATAFHARTEPRLFDEMLEWLLVNQGFVNVQRLKRLAAESAASAVVGALATWLAQETRTAKWTRAARTLSKPAEEPQPLFRFADGRPLPVLRDPFGPFRDAGFLRDMFLPRGHGRLFAADEPAAAVLKLRAAMGLTCRAEIVAWLLTHKEGTASGIARACAFAQRTVHDSLVEMRASGLVAASGHGREVRVYLNAGLWRAWLGFAAAPLAWVAWRETFRLFEYISQAVDEPRQRDAVGASLAMNVAVLLRDAAPLARAAGFAPLWSRLVPATIADPAAALHAVAMGTLGAVDES